MADERTALVVGAQGVLGNGIVQALRRNGWSVYRGGRRPEDTEDFRLIDLEKPETFKAACSDVDVVVSSIYDPAFALEKYILQSGGLLLNASTHTKAQREELKLFGQGAKGVALVNTGMTGVAAIAGKEMLQKYPESDHVDISWLFKTNITAGNAAAEYVKRVFSHQSRHKTRVVDFERPLGRKRSLITDGIEALMSDEVLNGKTSSMSIGLAERPVSGLVLTVNALHCSKLLPKWMFTIGLNPNAVSEAYTRELMRVRLDVFGAGKRLASKIIEFRGDYYTTAAATALFADFLYERSAAQELRGGCYCSEDVFDFDIFRESQDKIDLLERDIPT